MPQRGLLQRALKEREAHCPLNCMRPLSLLRLCSHMPHCAKTHCHTAHRRYNGGLGPSDFEKQCLGF